ncbi:MAG: C-terminal binding protein [Chloroflexi bacterium]|nr:C-terminal binding protein [Chloroflexota bacterium]
MARFTVAHIDARTTDLPREREALATADAELIARLCRSDDEVIEFARGADAILCTGYPVGEKVLAGCPDVKVAVRYGVGFDNIDLDAATARGVVVCNVNDYCIDEVATHAFALLIALNRKLTLHDRAVRRGERAPLPPTGPLRGETLGLVAFGKIARAVAERARGFGLQVIANDPYVDPAIAERAGVRLTSLEEVMRTSDYVSVHTPLNVETRGLIGAAQLALMKPTAYLVTTCRGGVVEERALFEALRDGRIAGAGVDVWDPEPVRADHPLLTLDNVIATPHSAYYSDRSAPLLQTRVGEAAADVLRGYLPRSVVNPAVLERVKLAAHPGR